MLTRDIAVNLTDPQFTGSYHGRTKHESDLDAVVARARGHGVERMIITGTSLEETKDAVEMASRYGECSAWGEVTMGLRRGCDGVATGIRWGYD